MDVKVRRKIVVCFELSELDAELIAADLTYLLEHSKNLPGIVRAAEAPFVVDSYERLVEFTDLLKDELKGRRRK